MLPLLLLVALGGLVLFSSQAQASPGSQFPAILPLHVYNVQFQWKGGGSGPIPTAVLDLEWGPIGIAQIGLQVVVDPSGVGHAQVQASPLILAGHFLDTPNTHWTGVSDLGPMAPQIPEFSPPSPAAVATS